MKDATARQQEVLRAILSGKTSLREIGAALGITWRGACDHLHALRRKGYVDWLPGRKRTLRLRVVPILGPAGVIGFTTPGQ